MTTGELWVAHPLFPWIAMTLSWWVGVSTIVMARNWVRIRKLERHNKLLQVIVIEGVGSLARRTTAIENRIPILKPIRREEKDTSELCAGESRIRTEEPDPAAIEEADEDCNDFAVVESENK